MTKGTNQKLKMLYLKQIFEEETDDQHSLTLQNITERLNSLGLMPTARRCIRTSRNSNATAWTSSPCRKAARGTIIWEAVILNYRKSSSSSIPCRHPNSSTSTNRTPLSASSKSSSATMKGRSCSAKSTFSAASRQATNVRT